MVGWHHRLNESEQTPGASKAQGSPECCSSWGHRVRRDLATEQHQQLINKSLWSVCVCLLWVCVCMYVWHVFVCEGVCVLCCVCVVGVCTCMCGVFLHVRVCVLWV